MRKIISKIAGTLLGLSLALGIGVFINARNASETKAADTSVSLDFTSSSYGISGTQGDQTLTGDGATYGFEFKKGTGTGAKYNSSYVLFGKAGVYFRNTSAPSNSYISAISWTYSSGVSTNVQLSLSYGASALTAQSSAITSFGKATKSGTVSLNPTDQEKSYFFIYVTNAYNCQLTNFSVTWSSKGGSTTYGVTYDGNGATSGTVPIDGTSYSSGASVTVKPNSGNLAKLGYTFGGWNTKADGTGTTYAAGSGTFNISAATTLYAKWNADTLNSLSISGAMSKTNYKDGDSWNADGFSVTGNYASGATPDLTSLVTWSYYVGGSVSTAASVGDTSVVVRASYGGKTVDSIAQSVTVVAGVTYDLTTISGFSTWTTSYGAHDLTQASFSPAVGTSANLNFEVTNKQSSGIGSTYPCIGSKTNSEVTCLTFTLTEAGKKITSIDITFVVRYTSTYPSLYLHKGNGIASTPLNSLTMSGSQGNEQTLSYDNLNDTVFTVGYNAHQTSSNGAVGIKSISIGLAEQASFGTLDHISVSALPNVIYHVGETYDSTGLAVTAYDGADEATANFKDVTSEVSTSLDGSAHVFADSEVPGFDCTVSYSGDGGSDTDSFHVYVYALAEYELVTSEPSDWSGNYLIVGTNGESELGAMNGGLSNPDVEKGYKVVTEKSTGVIEAGQELEWVVASVSGGYSVQGKSGKYIGSLTAKNNGMLVDDNPLVNTFSISGENVSITGTNTYGLTLNTTGDRFRYYNGGTVKLYRLKVSDHADEYAQLFLGAFTCDSTGENAPTFTIKEGSTYWSWSLLEDEYDNLTAVEKEQFRLGVPSSSGSNIEQAIARYDLIVRKYGWENFMARTVTLGAPHVQPITASNSSTIVIVVVALTSITSIGVLLVIKRKRSLVK